jgi:hypothetical protein
MIENVEAIRGTGACATRHSEIDHAELKHRATYGSWPRGSLGEDIVEDFRPQAFSGLDRAA